MPKQHYCFLEKFNNYFNRKIIKLDTVAAYQAAANNSFIPTTTLGAMTPYDFNPNDNITTEIIMDDLTFVPDYFLLLDTNGDIASRWFVLEQKRNRQGQWLYTLRRDVIADNLDTLQECPIYVEKGMLPTGNPLTLVDEGMSLNQIKKSEELLKDTDASAWLVGYIDKSSTPASVNIQAPSSVIQADYITLAEIATAVGMTESDLSDLLNFDETDINPIFFTNTVDFQYGYYYKDSTDQNASGHSILSLYSDFSFRFSVLNRGGSSANIIFDVNHMIDRVGMDDTVTNGLHNNKTQIVTDMPTILNRDYYLQTSQMGLFNQFNGKIVKYNNKYYTFNLKGAGTTQHARTNFSYSLSSGIKTAIDSAAVVLGYPLATTPMVQQIVSYEQVCYIELNYIADSALVAQCDLTLSSSRNGLADEGYDMIAIPISNALSIKLGTNNYFDNNGTYAKRIANALLLNLDDKMFDMQLLPYCPFRAVVSGEENEIDVSNVNVNVDYDLITITVDGVTTNVGIVLYPQSNSFSFNIAKELKMTESSKVDSNCNFYRLCSPNYQGGFQFNVAKNGGLVNGFNVYCTYKPFSPFIKVAPEFNLLYGSDYNDNRGLICGGDFSITRLKDAWQNYQLNNKNYQNIFNRDIQHLEFEQSIERRNQLISGAVGILGDTAKGAAAGGYVGGPVGGAVGGIIGGGMSAVGYAVDVDTLARQQREAKQLAIDKFNYQLGNIKALPNTLTKVGTFDISSKIFPFLEFYSCTDIEKEVFNNKILYESMTVMAIGTLSQYINSLGDNEKYYFKGRLIRNDAIADDPHTMNAIYEELLKGVYI